MWHGDGMTGVDRLERQAGYWPAAWPVECGGNRRQKASSGRLDAALGEVSVTTRHNGCWNVMVVQRDLSQWYLGGTMASFCGPAPYGWVERIDPRTLEPLASSSELRCGDHVWCGAILAHANGSIYSVNGSFLHRLHPDDLTVLAERELPVDRSHNGLLALADGTLVTKDLRLEGQGGTTVTRLDPDTLELIHEPVVLPEGSMGRIAADVTADGSELVYVPGTEHVWRLKARPDRLDVDTWRPRYRRAGDSWGLSWDCCLSGGACWIMDCGDIESVRLIHGVAPNGRFAESPGNDLSWRRRAPWPGAQRLLRVAISEPGPAEMEWVEPFGKLGGGIIAPPVHVAEHDMAIAWDSINGGLAGVSTSGGLEAAWHLEVRPSMQPVVFPESGELVINDFTDAGSDDIVVVDIATGALIDRVPTGSRIANGMFLTPDGDRGLFYCSTLTVAHITWN